MPKGSDIGIVRAARRLKGVLRSLRREAHFTLARARMQLTGSCALATDLRRYGKKVYSQNDEDGILEYVFHCLGATDRFFVEIGVGPPWSPKGFAPVEVAGLECNTRLLVEEHGWRGVLLDGQDYPPSLGVKQEFITAENVNELLGKYGVPHTFDLFSLDVDGNDYWIWNALEYEPRVVVIEFNATLEAHESKTIKYDPTFDWSGRGHTNYYGASLLALTRLGKRKGYVLVYGNGVNAIFVKEGLVPNRAEWDFTPNYQTLKRSVPPISADDHWVEIP